MLNASVQAIPVSVEITTATHRPPPSLDACGVSRAVGSSLTVAGSALCYLCLGALHCGSMRDVCVCARMYASIYALQSNVCLQCYLSVCQLTLPQVGERASPALCQHQASLTGRNDHIQVTTLRFSKASSVWGCLVYTCSV